MRTTPPQEFDAHKKLSENSAWCQYLSPRVYVVKVYAKRVAGLYEAKTKSSISPRGCPYPIRNG